MSRCVFIGLLAVGLVGLAPLASAQPFTPTFSIDYQSITKGTPDAGFGFPITEGDILGTMLIPGPPPFIVMSGGFGAAPPGPGLGLPAHPNAVGPPAGHPGQVEVDALSYGNDYLDTQIPPTPFYPRTWAFSVDEFAFGLQPPPPLPPNVSTEGALAFIGGGPPGMEASADLFCYFPPGAYPMGAGPFPPFALPPGNFDFFDGDGLGPILPFSLGLVEPNIPNPGPLMEPGDNLDAVDVDTTVFIPGHWPVYFSLDSGTAVFDPIEGVPGSNSAAVNGPFRGGDVLVTPGLGAGPMLYAHANMLGLDLFGPNTDDLDALVLNENGDGIFTPAQNPYDWDIPGAAFDMLFFSVRRGSAIIGTPDFFFGAPIEAGDILTPAGPPGSPPGIWMSAESLGLCPNPLGLRGMALPPGACPIGPWGPLGDDLNALDFVQDCDDDGFPDAIAIATGMAIDANGNGIPDNCEGQVQNFVRGECNADGLFNIADPIFLLNFLFAGGPPGPCESACDCNDSDVIDIADAVCILGALFSVPAVPPPPPYPGCGPDPTSGVLTCNSFPPCP